MKNVKKVLLSIPVGIMGVLNTLAVYADSISGKVATGTLGSETTSLAYTNTKTQVIPTGISMSIIPVITITAIAAVVFVVSLKRRAKV